MLAIPADSYSCGQHLMFLDYSAASPECRFSIPAPESHRSVAPLAPIGEVVAESYPIRTVIQLSGRLIVLPLINWKIIFDLNEDFL